MFTIYEVTNNLTQDTYVGLTRYTPQKRLARHLANARDGMNTHFCRAIRKYGLENFSTRAVASVLIDTDAGMVERQVIQTLLPRYNSTNGGEVTVGRRATVETIAKITAANRGKKRTPEQNRAMSKIKQLQYAADPTYRQKVNTNLVKAMAKVDPAKRIAAVRLYRIGRPLSPETRAKMSASRMGLVYSREVIQKMADSKKRPVICHTLGISFDSVSQAAEKTGLSVSGVSRVCRGDRGSAKGLTFSFLERGTI